MLYFASYIVLDPGETGLDYKQILSEKEYQDARETYGNKFRVGMGAEAIKELLQAIDLETEAEELKTGLRESSGQKRARIIKRLEVVEAFRVPAGGADKTLHRTGEDVIKFLRPGVLEVDHLARRVPPETGSLRQGRPAV